MSITVRELFGIYDSEPSYSDLECMLIDVPKGTFKDPEVQKLWEEFYDRGWCRDDYTSYSWVIYIDRRPDQVTRCHTAPQ